MKATPEPRAWTQRSQPGGEHHPSEGSVSDHWVLDYFRAIDSKDVPTVVEAFAEDGTFRFGNSEPAVGRPRVEGAITAFNSSIGGLSHDIISVWSAAWEGGAVKIVEAKVTYTRKDGTRTEPLPVVSALRMRGDQIQDFRIFMDIAPLFAQ